MKHGQNACMHEAFLKKKKDFLFWNTFLYYFSLTNALQHSYDRNVHFGANVWDRKTFHLSISTFQIESLKVTCSNGFSDILNINQTIDHDT